MNFEGHSVGAGERAFIELDVAYLANGSKLALPVHVLNGSRAGPTMTLVSGLHGDENLFFEIFTHFLRALKPSELSGSVILLPDANPLAVGEQTRNNPVDQLDLNRNFPGKKDGWLTEKIANVITEKIVKRSTYLIDFHTAPPFLCVDYCFVDPSKSKIAQDARRLSRAFGHRFVYECPELPTTLTHAALTLGVPCITSETGDASKVEDSYGRDVSDRIMACLAEVGMLSTRKGVHPKKVEQVMFPEDAYASLRPGNGGILIPDRAACTLGKKLKRGHRLATIYNPYTLLELETMRTPFSESTIFMYRMRSAIRPGDYAFIVGDGSKSRVG